MSAATNKEIVRRYFDERWNRHNPDICDELLAPGADTAGIKAWLRSQYAALGSTRLTILDLLAEGDQVSIHWRIDANHQGEYMGVPATGKPFSFAGIALLRVVDGKIADDIAYFDSLAILRQLGAAPA